MKECFFWKSRVTLNALLVAIFLLSGCSEEEKVVHPLSNIATSLYDIGSYSARIMVTHDGNNRDLYCCFTLNETDVQVELEIQSYCAAHSAAELVSSAYSQKKQIIDVTGLRPEKTYTCIVFGITGEGERQGTPSSLIIHTTESDIIFSENPNWSIVYDGQTDYNNKTYSRITTYLTGEVEERYFLSVNPNQTFNSQEDLIDFLHQQINEFNSDENTDYDSDFFLEASEVRTGSTYFFRYLQPGQYQAFAIGVNADGSPTGHYAKSEVFTVEKYQLKEGYANLVNHKWKVTDATGKSFVVTFETRYANSSLKMMGWGGWKDAPIIVQYAMDTQKLTVSRQLISDVNQYESSDGQTHNGQMFLNGWYHSSSGDLKLVSLSQSTYKVSVGSLQSDGSYILENGFTVSLDSNGTKSSTYGMTLEFYESYSSYGYFKASTMQFPISIKPGSTL